jgi:hypothetical protein
MGAVHELDHATWLLCGIQWACTLSLRCKPLLHMICCQLGPSWRAATHGVCWLITG